MEHQLASITLQEMTYKRELTTFGEIVELTALDDWEQAAREYFLDLKARVDSLNFTPESEEDEQEIYELKRGIIKALVNRVTIDKRRELRVEVRLNLLEILRKSASTDFASIQMGETYTGLFDVTNILVEL